MCVAMHQVMYGGKGDRLFRGAILESGAVSSLPWVSASSTTQTAIFNLASMIFGCGWADNKLDCLRGLSKETVYNVSILPVGVVPFGGPTIDGSMFPENPIKLLKSGKHFKVPTLLGANEDEGSLFVGSIDEVLTGGPRPNTTNDTRQAISGNTPEISTYSRPVRIPDCIRSRQTT
jgi:carboxylesterase type B